MASLAPTHLKHQFSIDWPVKKLTFALITLALISLHGPARAEDDSGVFTVFLARHAEKEADPADPSDPPLSSCGEQRAEALAGILASVGLEKIYSTPYHRTMSTAHPSAVSHALEVETYDPRRLETFAATLLERGQDALVIGHSNTTGVLAGLLAGEAGEAFDEGIYDRLYLVIVSGASRRVYLLGQGFDCGL
jgi:broad specificity phosphatase PhoE